MSSDTTDTTSALDGFEQRLRQRAAAVKADPLQTIPVQADHQPRGRIPNTPLSVALISFLLGSLFAFGLLLFATNGFGLFWWSTSQLGFFLAAWSAFHWGEFAVTAGWNREKCSVDCEDRLVSLQLYSRSHSERPPAFLLENGAMYHVAHSVALTEYLITLYFKPEWKHHQYVSLAGESCHIILDSSPGIELAASS